MEKPSLQSVFFLRTRIVSAGHPCKPCKGTAVPRSRPDTFVFIDWHIHDVVAAACGADVRAAPAVLAAVAQIFPELVRNFIAGNFLNGFTEKGTRIPELLGCFVHDLDEPFSLGLRA